MTSLYKKGNLEVNEKQLIRHCQSCCKI